MKAMVLAAGQGSRLAPLTDHTPKPLLPVAGKPLILQTVERLKAAGISQIVINTHHLGGQIEAALGNGAEMGVSIQYSQEPELLETGGGIKKALPILKDEIFVLCNGDIYSDFDLQTLPTSLTAGDLAHLVLVPKPPSREHGDFVCREGRVVGRGSDYVYAGVATIHADLFQFAPAGAFSLRDLLFDAVAKQRVGAQIHSGQWIDIGTPEDYRRANASITTD